MAGLDPAIYVDPRVKPGDDEKGVFRLTNFLYGAQLRLRPVRNGSVSEAFGHSICRL
jgi:hypothetical protein